MTRDARVPEPPAAWIRVVAGRSAETGEEGAGSFARGLALGALVGAAIAGSTIWHGHLARRSRRAT